MTCAVFISNNTEWVAGTTGMRSGGSSCARIPILWVTIAVECAGAAAVGYAVLDGLSPAALSFVLTFSAGATLMILANTMIPEACEHAGELAGVLTVIGFAVSVAVIVLEKAGAG